MRNIFFVHQRSPYNTFKTSEILNLQHSWTYIIYILLVRPVLQEEGDYLAR